MSATERVIDADRAPPALRRAAQRKRELDQMKQRATGLLALIVVAFVVARLVWPDRGWTGFVLAGLEGSMVGGLADWFAVTAVFRHPLGLPIPHTAVIAERKDQFGLVLGEFVQENFLSAPAIIDRIEASRAVERAGAWLADPAHASTLAANVMAAVATVTEVVRDEDIHPLIDQSIRRGVEAVALAPLAGRALRLATDQGRHQEALDAALRAAERFLDDNQADLRERFGQGSPWWLPGPVEDRIFDRVLDHLRTLLHEINSDPAHELRGQLDHWVARMAHRLEHDDALLERGEQIKRELLDHPELRAWSASIWNDVKAEVREQAERPESALRLHLAHAVAIAGRRVSDDATVRQAINEHVEAAVGQLTGHFQGELSALVSGTISRWNSADTSDRIELLLGRDLQFIRINGTVVGGLAGMAIHALALAL